jgi:hypothetical protein
MEMAAFFSQQSSTQSFSVTTINRDDVVAWGDE